MGAAKQQNHNEAWDSQGEAAKLRRAMLDAFGKSLRHRFEQDLQSPVPPSLSRLVEDLKRAEGLRRRDPPA